MTQNAPKPDMTGFLKQYQDALREIYRLEGGRDEAKDCLKKMCSGEQRKLTRAVKRIIANARPGWRLYESQCRVSINHATRPYTCHIVAAIKVNYCVGRRRGTIDLHGNIAEVDEILAELRALVGEAK